MHVRDFVKLASATGSPEVGLGFIPPFRIFAPADLSTHLANPLDNQPVKRHRRISTLVALPLALGLLVGCDLFGEPPGFGQGIKVGNNTDVDLTFQAIEDDTPVPLPARVGPGESGIPIGANALTLAPSRWGANGCTSVEIVAVGPEVDEVERVKPPLCLDDEWIVGGD